MRTTMDGDRHRRRRRRGDVRIVPVLERTGVHAGAILATSKWRSRRIGWDIFPVNVHRFPQGVEDGMRVIPGCANEGCAETIISTCAKCRNIRLRSTSLEPRGPVGRRGNDALKRMLSSERIADGFIWLICLVCDRGIRIRSTRITTILVCLLPGVPLDFDIHLVDG